MDGRRFPALLFRSGGFTPELLLPLLLPAAVEEMGLDGRGEWVLGATTKEEDEVEEVTLEDFCGSVFIDGGRLGMLVIVLLLMEEDACCEDGFLAGGGGGRGLPIGLVVTGFLPTTGGLATPLAGLVSLLLPFEVSSPLLAEWFRAVVFFFASGGDTFPLLFASFTLVVFITEKGGDDFLSVLSFFDPLVAFFEVSRSLPEVSRSEVSLENGAVERSDSSLRFDRSWLGPRILRGGLEACDKEVTSVSLESSLEFSSEFERCGSKLSRHGTFEMALSGFAAALLDGGFSGENREAF